MQHPFERPQLASGVSNAVGGSTTMTRLSSNPASAVAGLTCVLPKAPHSDIDYRTAVHPSTRTFALVNSATGWSSSVNNRDSSNPPGLGRIVTRLEVNFMLKLPCWSSCRPAAELLHCFRTVGTTSRTISSLEVPNTMVPVAPELIVVPVISPAGCSTNAQACFFGCSSADTNRECPDTDCIGCSIGVGIDHARTGASP